MNTPVNDPTGNPFPPQNPPTNGEQEPVEPIDQQDDEKEETE